MENETRRLLLIIGTLLVLIAGYILLSEHHEASRPVLREVRVVSACSSDPVFRDGARQIGPAEQIQLAVALRIERRGGESSWLAPVGQLVLDGQPVAHVQAEQWPEKDRYVRAFWFTIECAHLGGGLTEETAKSWLQYRSFLVQEMGQELLATPQWLAKNAEFRGSQVEAVAVAAGTLRFYARVEIADTSHRVRSLQAASSLGPDQLANPALPVISRRAALTELAPKLTAVVGELFLLPGFEPPAASPHFRYQVPPAALELSFDELVERRLATSSQSLAAMAVAGQQTLDKAQLKPLGRLQRTDLQLRRDGQPVSWAGAIRAGDLLVTGGHWLVLLEDDGNGVLDEADEVLHCWHDPPVRQPLREALELAESTFDLLRYVAAGS